MGRRASISTATGREHVRAFFIENALHWLSRISRRRLPPRRHARALDDGPRHFLAECADARARRASRARIVIAEDERKLRRMVRSPQAGGWGLDARVGRRLPPPGAAPARRRPRELLRGVQRARCPTSHERSRAAGSCAAPRTTRSRRCRQPIRRWAACRSQYVICLQNHDQVGNRALGERLHHQIDPAAYRAATALLLCAPETPLLFMGQEWAASTPFLYFTDHPEALGRLVTEGRRQEFSGFEAVPRPGAARAHPRPAGRRDVRGEPPAVVRSAPASRTSRCCDCTKPS